MGWSDGVECWDGVRGMAGWGWSAGMVCGARTGGDGVPGDGVPGWCAGHSRVGMECRRMA